MGNPAIFNGRRTKLLTADGLLLQTNAIVDNNGDVNYIPNGHAEVNTAGWATYANAAGAAPVNGTGGSPVVTWTRSTTTPLAGQGSFLLTKDAANRQGEGASYSFTIASEDQAQVLSIKARYKISSGTFVAAGNPAATNPSDVTVWIYDVTNAVLIQPSSISLFSNSTTIADQFQCEFQTNSNSTSYRLIFHVGSVSALAYTLQFDDIQVTPSQYVFGSPINDEVVYTMTIGGVTTPPTKNGAPVVDRATWSRRGDKAIIRYTYGQTTGGTAGSGVYLFPLPTGLSADLNKVSVTTNINGASGSVLGTAQTSTVTTTGANSANGTVLLYNATNLQISIDNGSTTKTVVASGAYSLGGQIYYSFTAEVPIAGWSSSVQMADQTSTRIVSASYYCSANFTGSASVPYNFDSKDYDTHNAVTVSPTAWRFTAPCAGLYEINMALFAGAGGASNVTLYKGGTSYKNVGGSGSAALTAGTAQTTVNMLAGEYIDIRPIASNAITGNASMGAASGTAPASNITITRISGPSQIAASDSQNCSYSNTAGTSVANTGYTLIPFATRDFDSTMAYNPATGVYTAQTSGKFRVSATVNFASATYGVNNEVMLAVYKNAALYRVSAVQPIMAIVTLPFGDSVNCTVQLNAGDTIDIRVRNTRSGGATSLDTTAGYNHVEIDRIGN